MSKCGVGDKVELISTTHKRLKPGMRGIVTNFRIADEQVLVKWVGVGWPHAHEQHELKRIQ